MKSYSEIDQTLRVSRWELGDVIFTGVELFDHLKRCGLVNDWRDLTDIPIGGIFHFNGKQICMRIA